MDNFLGELVNVVVRTAVRSAAKTVETALIPPKKKAEPRRRRDD